MQNGYRTENRKKYDNNDLRLDAHVFNAQLYVNYVNRV